MTDSALWQAICRGPLPQNGWPHDFSHLDYDDLTQLCTGDEVGSDYWSDSVGLHCDTSGHLTLPANPLPSQQQFVASFQRLCRRSCDCFLLGQAGRLDLSSGSDSDTSSDVSMESVDYTAIDCHGDSCYSAARSCPLHCLCSAPKPGLLSPFFDLGASACVAVVMKALTGGGSGSRIGGRSTPDDNSDNDETQRPSLQWLNSTSGHVGNTSTSVRDSQPKPHPHANRTTHIDSTNAVLSNSHGQFYNLSSGQQIACYCNETYVSYACCAAARPWPGPPGLVGIVHEPAENRLGPPDTIH